MEDLHLGQTREGGGQQATPLGILPEQIHDFVVLFRHRVEVVANIPVQGTEAKAGIFAETAPFVNASAGAFRNLWTISLGSMQGLWRSVRPPVYLAMPHVVIRDPGRRLVAGQLVAAPEDQDIDGQRVLLVLWQLHAQGLDLGLHLIGNVAQRLTPKGRAPHFPLHVEPAVLLAFLLEALRKRNFCEVPLALGALAKDYGAIADYR